MLRKEYLDRLWRLKDLEVIKVVTGVRRCGKSTLLRQFRDRLKESGVADERIVSLNFEMLEDKSLLDHMTLYEYLTSRICDGEYTYFFLDEVQVVPSFQRAVDSLFVKDKVDIYIAGSNSCLLSGELATFLSGRYIEINMLPLSYREYLDMWGSNDRFGLFDDYADHGGMPYASEIRKNALEAEDAYMRDVYDTIFVKDIESRLTRRDPGASRKVADIPLLKKIAEYLSDVIGSPVSIGRMAGYLTSSGRKTAYVTVDNYVESLEESYLFYKAKRMDLPGKAVLNGNQKYYIVDTGFRRCALAKERCEPGFTLENIVYLELLRRGYEVNVGRIGDTEVDFVTRYAGIYRYFQVTATMVDRSVFEREMRPLRNIRDNYEKTVLTFDRVGLGDYDGIKVVNVIDWLCDDSSTPWIT